MKHTLVVLMTLAVWICPRAAFAQESPDLRAGRLAPRPLPVPLAAPAGTARLAKPDGLSSGACDSWGAACELQYALSIAVAGDEIWAKTGTYKPTDGSDRMATFQLVSGVGLYGGFAGTEDTRDGRDPDPATNNTVLSGNIGDAADPGDNSYHVVTSNGVAETTALDGFTITGGNALGVSVPPGDNLWGGGMYNEDGSPALANVTFSGNTAYYGGGGMVNENGSPALTNVTFSGNTAYYDGGGMYNGSNSSPTLTDVAFSSNQASGAVGYETYTHGGGMYNLGSNPTLTNVTFSGNSADYGGGMYNDSSGPTVTDGTFSGNTAAYAGGGMDNDDSSPTLSNVTLSDNTAQDYGGGMYNCSNSSPTLSNVTLSGNTAASGGGMYNEESSPTLTDVTFSDNTVTEEGAGMSNHLSSSTLTQVTFSGNSGLLGGGLFDSTSNSTLTHVTFYGNSAADGGAMCDDGQSHETLLDVTFSDNTADYGGAMYLYNSSLTLTNVSFRGNIAEYTGGGIAISSGRALTMTNAVFDGNTAGQYGGGMATIDTSPTLTNVTFSDNTAGSEGGAMYSTSSSSPTLTNCILWGNVAGSGAEIASAGSTPAISYSNVQGSGGSGGDWDSSLGSDGGDNIDADPTFVAAAAGDLRLQLTSPTIDAGDNGAVPPAVTTDLAGDPRIGGLVVDMGAYEAGLDLSIVKSVEPALAEPGQAITYTLVFSNVAGSVATGVILSDVVPSSVDVTGFENLSGLLVTPTEGVSFAWQVEPLSPGEGGIIALKGVIGAGASGVFSLTNRATITATEVDEHPANNTATVSSTVGAQPPRIVAVSPADGAKGVAVTMPLVITFSEAIEPGSLAFSTSPDPGGWSALWNETGTAVTLGHAPGVPATTHTATVSTAADLMGNPLAGAPYVWRFTTGGARAYLPLVLRKTP